MKLTTLILLLGAQLIAEAAVLRYSTTMDGPSEAPPNASPGTGFASLTYDDVARTLRVQASFSGLLGTTTAAHIHGPTAAPFAGTAAVATQTPSFVGFPLGVTSGTFDALYDLSLVSSYSAGFLSGFAGDTALAEAALMGAVAEGKAYFNVHSTSFAGGEIRGFFVLAPDAGATGTLLLLASACGFLFRRASR